MQTDTRECQNCKQNFTIEEEDFEFYKKIDVPPPTFCPDCRMQRRMSWRNERTLYKDTCDLCKKSMLSMYSPDKPYTVYCKECWYGDGWDPFQYGRDYNFNRSFFDQFQDLIKVVPRPNLMYLKQNVGCEFANFVGDVKNAYLSFSIVGGENIYYSRSVDSSRDVFDSLNSRELERCYDNVDSERNYESAYLFRSRDCLQSRFLFDSVNCQNCFMSSNLRSKQYVFRNQQLTKEQYEGELKKINLGSRRQSSELRTEFRELIAKALHKFANTLKVNESTGDNISNLKNCVNIFDAYDCENSRHCVRVFKLKECYDVIGSAGGQMMYETVGSGMDCQTVKFLAYGDALQNAEYSDWCPLSTNIFGCTALRKKNYCIFNKQYSKEEFRDLRAKIIEQMKQKEYVDKNGRVYRYGEFFPVETSYYAYNETVAQEYFPLTKDQAISQGYSWREPDSSTRKATTTIESLPDDSAQAGEDVLKQIIECAGCKHPYRIVPAELEFLKLMKLSLPDQCPECRYRARFALRTPLKLWHRQCMCLSLKVLSEEGAYQNTSKHSHGDEPCANEFQTSYSIERPEMVYCEQCYQAEVV